ncbi:hypothetical protein ACGFRB_11515 [Streptomyces sp. NPDC048718]|uniref:hypothetical protein n=1 Tax=Streptomyces sp. NPDC048718 TaxID=3365587 RepID=UPI003721CD3C
MAPMPPPCPRCTPAPMLWKDTTRAVPATPDRWTWFCASCRRHWEPTAQEKRELTHAPGEQRGPLHPLSA